MKTLRDGSSKFIVSRTDDCRMAEVLSHVRSMKRDIEDYLLANYVDSSDRAISEFAFQVAERLFFAPLLGTYEDKCLTNTVTFSSTSPKIYDHFIFDYWEKLSTENFRIEEIKK